MRFLVLLFFFISTLLASEKLDSISLQLSWLHQFQSAGFYVAQEKGFYQDVGLHVTFKEYAVDIDVVEDVLAQKSNYGIGRPSLIVDRNNNKDVIALLALFQSTPFVLITTNPKIQTLKDLIHKKIMITPNEMSTVSIFSMILGSNVSLEDLIIQKDAFKVQNLIDNNADAMVCYISNEPFSLDKNHIPYKMFQPKDFGFDFYGDILFTSGDEIRNHPNRVKNFYTATKKGWEWAFNNIEESSKIIYEKYNSQNKSLEALIYEGYELKKLAFTDNKEFGTIELKKFEEMAKIYRLSGLLKKDYSFKGFIDPLHLSRKVVNIGVFDNKGNTLSLDIWQETADYLSEMIPSYYFVIRPFNFKELEESVKRQELEFIITNPMHYIQLEHVFGISRIATLSSKYQDKYYTHYGSVIFTRADNPSVQNFQHIVGKKVGAVSQKSFGGFIAAIKELKNHNVEQNDFKNIAFFKTQEAVVKAILDKTIDVGIVRTDVLEDMQQKGLINIHDIKVLEAKKYENFPLLISTSLYPQWPFSKAPHTSEDLSNDVLSALIKTSTSTIETQNIKWKTPLDYSNVENVIKELKIYPYDREKFTFKDVLYQYKYLFIIIFFIFILMLLAITHIKNLNRQLIQKAREIENFNNTLEEEVVQRTHELKILNEKLKELANTDELTRIDNRRHFMQLATMYFHSAKRNNTELYILSLDIDFFKKVNDTYGHAIGDEILKLICKTTNKILRQSDIFGRIGGEEFCICLQNSSLEGARTLAETIRIAIETTPYKISLEEQLHVTVSIGIAGLRDEDKDILEVMQRADNALYKAKGNGRNQVQIFAS